uniref:Centromere protein J n=1 Tax=Terrapene triunguis TaxID=2587831 RepID=A0A674J5J1_9SAUR
MKCFQKMSKILNLNSEQNVIIHWMSNASCSGDILNPSFHIWKTNRDGQSSGAVNIINHPVKMLHVSNSSSISEDSMHEEQILESGCPCGLQLNTTETTFPVAAFHLVKKKPTLTLKDAPALWKAPKTDSVCDEGDDQNEADYSDPLLQKLEQISGSRARFNGVTRTGLDLLVPGSRSQNPSIWGQSLRTGKDFGFAPLLGHWDFGPAGLRLRSHLLRSSSNFLSEVGSGAMRAPGLDLNLLKEFSRVGRKQTFEEFLEEQIRLEDQRLKQKEEQQKTGPLGRSTFQKLLTRRPFLKRGEGLTRFTNAKSKVTKYKESKLMTQQSTLEDRNVVKVDRPQIQRKTAPLSKEQVSENFAVPSKKCNRAAKTTNDSVFPVQKAIVLKNHIGKNISPPTARLQTEKNLGQFRDSFRSEINNKFENKENIMEFAGPIDIFSDTEKPQLSTEFTETFSLSKCSTSHPVKDPELSFELSFQNKLENWEKEKEKENIELDEFLFLEQAADEVSFSSNSSFVQMFLDRDQQISKGRRMSSTPVKTMLQQQMNALDIINNKNKKAEIILQGNKNRAITHTVLDLRASIRLRDQFNKTDSKIFQTSSTTASPTLKSTEWNVNEDKDDGSSVITTKSEEEHETTLKCANEDAKKFILSIREDNPAFCDCTGPVKDLSKESKSRDVDLDLSDKDYSSDESSLLPNQSNSKVSESQRSVSCTNRNKVEFDDERTWTDLQENEIQHEAPQNDTIKVPPQTDYYNKSEMAAPDKTIKRKVASIKKGDDLPKQSVTDGDASTPPTSDLMMKLFPSLKPKQKPDCHARHETKSNVGQEEPGGDIVRSRVLREKLVELETEIERFRAENASLTKLREERENSLENLRREIADFEQQKKKELARIEEVKKEETRKLQKDRKVFEKYSTAARAMPDKKERDEIQALKQQLADLQEDLKRREAKWSTTHGRLRNQIETLTKENTELREEIKIMERFRLEVWKKAEAAESNRKAESSGMNLKRAESVVSCACFELLTREIFSFQDMSPTEICVPLEPPTLVSTGSEEIQGEINYPDGKVEKVLKNGCHLIFFPNGTRKEMSSDGKTITVTFFNGDVKQVMPDQRVVCLAFLKWHYPDGKKEITFPDQTIKNLFMDGREESIFPDGTIVRVQRDGSKTIEFNNGQRELHTPQFKRREYPDGTVKTVYANGHQETKYVCGRVRVKDKDGNVIMDTKL